MAVTQRLLIVISVGSVMARRLIKTRMQRAGFPKRSHTYSNKESANTGKRTKKVRRTSANAAPEGAAF